MSPGERRKAMRDVLRASVRGRRREVSGLVAWSVVEALPAFLSGVLLARALDEGFLAGDTQRGLTWLGVLAAAMLVGAWATRATFLRLASIVEPLRDALVTRTVDGSLGQAAAT